MRQSFRCPGRARGASLAGSGSAPRRALASQGHVHALDHRGPDARRREPLARDRDAVDSVAPASGTLASWPRVPAEKAPAAAASARKRKSKLRVMIDRRRRGIAKIPAPPQARQPSDLSSGTGGPAACHPASRERRCAEASVEIEPQGNLHPRRRGGVVGRVGDACNSSQSGGGGGRIGNLGGLRHAGFQDCEHPSPQEPGGADSEALGNPCMRWPGGRKPQRIKRVPRGRWRGSGRQARESRKSGAPGGLFRRSELGQSEGGPVRDGTTLVPRIRPRCGRCCVHCGARSGFWAERRCIGYAG